MDNNEIISELSNLAQLDIDAVEAYDEALLNIDVKTIYEEISSFRGDHVRHIDNLSAAISKLGGTPPEKKKILKDF